MAIDLRNNDGTYNVYDFTQEKWIVVNEDYLNNVDLKGALELEIHFHPTCSLELRVIKYATVVNYKNVHGSWGFPYKIV